MKKALALFAVEVVKATLTAFATAAATNLATRVAPPAPEKK